MRDEFYVGYLPTPPGLKRFLWTCVITILLAAGGIAAVNAARERDPGTGKWNLDGQETIEGTFVARPYPMVRTDKSLILLVGDGKFAATVDAGLDGQIVRVTGHRLDRDELALIEVEKVEPMSGSQAAPLEFSSPAAVTLRGEIIDPKCFAGAMKPGDGKPHKACATLCLRGGIPPVFVTWNLAGRMNSYILISQSGDPLTGEALESILPYVADVVEVTGTVRLAGGRSFLAVDASRVRRP